MLLAVQKCGGSRYPPDPHTRLNLPASQQRAYLTIWISHLVR